MITLDLSWLINALSHPLFTAIVGAIVGGLVGGLLIWVVFLRRINWEAMKEHFRDLKTLVIEPWIRGLEEIPEAADVQDIQLFNDLLEEHYPELKPLWTDYNEIKEEVGAVEKNLRKEILKRIETLLKKNKVRFQRTYSSDPNVCTSSYVADFVFGVMEQNRWYVHFLIKEEESAKLFAVKLNGTDLYRSPERSSAEVVKSVLEDITKTLVITPELIVQMRKVKELRGSRLEKLDELRSKLRDIWRKPKLRLRKKFWVFPRPCKYLKP